MAYHQRERDLSDDFDCAALPYYGKPEHLKYTQKPNGREDIVMSIRVPDHVDFPNVDGKKARHRRDGAGNSDRPFHDDDLVKKCGLVMAELNRRNPDDKQIGIYIKDHEMRIMSVYGHLDSTVEAARLIKRIFTAYSQGQHRKIDPLNMVTLASEESNVINLHEEKDRFVHFPSDYDVSRLPAQMKMSYTRLKNFIEKHFETVSVTQNGLHAHGIVLSGTNRFNVDAGAALAIRGINRMLDGEIVSEKWLNKSLPEVIESTEGRPETPNYHGIVDAEHESEEIVPGQSVKLFAPRQP